MVVLAVATGGEWAAGCDRLRRWFAGTKADGDPPAASGVARLGRRDGHQPSQWERTRLGWCAL